MESVAKARFVKISPRKARVVANMIRGKYADEALGIKWPFSTEALNLSEKDTKQPKLNETDDLFEYGVDYYA